MTHETWLFVHLKGALKPCVFLDVSTHMFPGFYDMFTYFPIMFQPCSHHCSIVVLSCSYILPICSHHFCWISFILRPDVRSKNHQEIYDLRPNGTWWASQVSLKSSYQGIVILIQYNICIYIYIYVYIYIYIHIYIYILYIYIYYTYIYIYILYIYIYIYILYIYIYIHIYTHVYRFTFIVYVYMYI